jgi:hypothetical protein
MFEIELDENLRPIRQKTVSREIFDTLPYEDLVGPEATAITLTLALTRPGWKPKVPGLG